MAPPSGEERHLDYDTGHSTDPSICEAPTDRRIMARPEETSEASGSDEPTPLMADIMSGPNAPLSKGFLMAQWRTIPVDRIFGDHHDLADERVQMRLHNLLPEAAFVWAALDCSTKTRCRNIPSRIPGRKLPPPLRSDEHPMGLPGLQGADKERVATDNTAAEFVLAEMQLHQKRGGGSGRENPTNSLRWSTPTEVDMAAGGTWWDQL